MTDNTSPFAHESLPVGINADPAAEHLGPADIREFQQLVKDNCGLWLDDGDAWTRATQLIDLLRMLMRPLSEDPEARAIVAGSSVVSLDETPKNALP